jgi:hypothetical protein
VSNLPEGGAVPLQQIRQGLTQRGQQMEPIHDLERLGRTVAGALGVDLRAITAEDADLGMLPQPSGQGLRRAIWQQVHDPVRLQIHQDRRIGLPPATRKVVDTEHLD